LSGSVSEHDLQTPLKKLTAQTAMYLRTHGLRLKLTYYPDAGGQVLVD
jgi:hypothetical protein